jgi:hypothetical protein
MMNRRCVLQGLALSPLALAANKFAYSQTSRHLLTMEGLEVFRAKVNHRGNWTVVRLKTNGRKGDAFALVDESHCLWTSATSLG